MDAFCLNAGAGGLGPDEPGPSSYAPKSPGDKINGGRFSNAVPKTEIEIIQSRSATIPGPGNYPMKSLLATGGGQFSNSKPKSYIDWTVYRSREIPGPSHYGAPALVSMEGGVLFGPTGGPEDFTAPRPMTAPQKLKYEATQKLPGPGSYERVDSVGPQVESLRKSPAKVTFGSGSRDQRRKIYMGHGVSTPEATLGEGPGFAYCHLYLPAVLQPSSPGVYFGDKPGPEDPDTRIGIVQKRRREIDRRRAELQEKMAAKVKEREKAARKQVDPYSWLRPRSTRKHMQMRGRRRDGPDLPRSREFRRPASVPFTTDARFNEAMLMPHSKAPHLGRAGPGPIYNVHMQRSATPSYSFTRYAKRTVEEVIERTVLENIPGPGAYPTDMSARMDALTEERDLVRQKLDLDNEEMEALQEKLETLKAKEAEVLAAFDAAMKKHETAETLEEGQLSDRAQQVARRSVKRARRNVQQVEREIMQLQRRVAQSRAEYRRAQTPSVRYGDNPLSKSWGRVPMATGTRDAADKMHFPGKKLNPATAVSPGPAAYSPADARPQTGGGRFSTSFPKDDVEWTMYRARQIPGPSDYVPIPMFGKVPISTRRSAANLCFATASRDVRAKQYMPGPLNGVLGGDSPGPQYRGLPTIGHQILSSMKNSTVPIFSTAKTAEAPVDNSPGPNAYKPPHAVYSKRIRDNRQKLIESKLASITSQVAQHVSADAAATRDTSRRRRRR